MSGVFRDDKVHGTFNGKVKIFSYDVDNSSKDQKCLKASGCSKLLYITLNIKQVLYRQEPVINVIAH